MKITNSPEKPDDILRDFREDYGLRITVTVDVVTIGMNVKPIEYIIFIQDMRSKNYFEQMKGRGIQALNRDGL